MCDILAQQLERGEASHEMTKMAAIMGEEVIETGDFVVNEKDKIVNLTEQGIKKVEKFFNIENLADPENLEIQHNIILALRAHNLMHKDQDYVVKDDEILIVDEFTGRIMPGRRYSDGLHQAKMCIRDSGCSVQYRFKPGAACKSGRNIPKGSSAEIRKHVSWHQHTSEAGSGRS